jgi:DNA-binding MarR family transcriptional regulator
VVHGVGGFTGGHPPCFHLLFGGAAQSQAGGQEPAGRQSRIKLASGLPAAPRRARYKGVVAERAEDDDVAAVTSALLTASRVLVAIAARSLAAAEERVTLPQFRMLVLLHAHGETNLVTLADRLAVNASTALRMVDRLVDGGFVARRAHPGSRREVLLKLTKTGRQIVDEVTARRREDIAAIVSAMSARNRTGLVRALRAFTAAGGEVSADEMERDLLPLGWE